MQDSFRNESIDIGTPFVGGIDLDEGIFPQLPLVEFAGDKLSDFAIANFEKTFEVAAVVANYFVSEVEYI